VAVAPLSLLKAKTEGNNRHGHSRLLGEIQRGKMAGRVLQNVLDGFADASRDFPGAFCRADSYVFSGAHSAFAN
jgi:hypothetical protein